MRFPDPAGVKSSDVVFSKAKLERDDGKLVYEIEFYSNYAEYDYTIDASSGTILEYETDKHEIDDDDDYDDGDDDDDDNDDDDDDWNRWMVLRDCQVRWIKPDLTLFL